VSLATSLDERIRVHDFRMVPGPSHSNLIFDILLPYDLSIPIDSIKERLDEKIHAIAPNYFTVITFDRSYV
jgi:hypothetical protein